MKRHKFARAAVLSPAAGTLMSKIEISKADAVTRQAPDGRMEIKLLTTGFLAIALVATSVFMFVPNGNSRNIVSVNQTKDRFTTVYKTTSSPSRAQLAQAAVCVNSNCFDV